jgi:hypothetical protein
MHNKNQWRVLLFSFVRVNAQHLRSNLEVVRLLFQLTFIIAKLNAPPEKCKVHLIRQNRGGALNLKNVRLLFKLLIIYKKKPNSLCDN